MAAWLYPISVRADRVFYLDDGSRLKVSVENYGKLVENGRLGEDELWGVSANFRAARAGDEVFIYTGDEDLGIIGYAAIRNVRRDEDPAFHLDFDLKKCAALLERPVPASLVRKWVLPRRAVVDLTPHLAKLRSLLPWKGGHAAGERLLDTPRAYGAGFGGAVQNKKVEEAAVRAVTAHYRQRGWVVESVEQKRLGFDLLCSKGALINKVEVKGISGEEVSFFLTRNERRAAEDRDFRLCAVCDALSKQPTIRTWTGDQMERSFTFTEVQYQASLNAR